jgi:type IV pilus assembly protein PilN
MIRINLLADRHAKDRLLIQQQIVMGALILVATFVLFGAWWSALSGDIADARAEIRSAEDELKKQEVIRDEVRAMEERKKRLENINNAITDLQAVKAGPTLYLDHINVLLPKEMWLTTLTDTAGSLTISGFSFSNTAVAQFMKNLEESDQFVNVSLREITQQEVEKESLQQFTVNAWTTLGKRLAEEKAKRDAEAAAADAKKKTKKRK